MFNKHGRIVSKKKSATAKREKRLEKAGYKPKKGKFVLMRKGNKTRKNHHKKRDNKKRVITIIKSKIKVRYQSSEGQF